LLAQKMIALGGCGTMAVEVCDLRACVDRAIGKLRHKLSGTHRIVVEEPDPIGGVTCATAQLVRVLCYLLENAWDATPGGGALRVDLVKLAASERWPTGAARIDITDEGCGMSDAALANAFLPFYSDPLDGISRAGLGLTAARSLLQAMGAELQLRSRLGEGTTASIHIARGTPEPREEPPELPDAITDGVLLLDDDPLVRAMCLDAIGQLNIRVFACSDGRSARALFDHSPDRFMLAVMDENVPGERGSSLARYMLGRNPKLRVLLMSGRPIPTGNELPPRQRQRMAVVHKPFGLLEFLSSIEQLIPGTAGQMVANRQPQGTSRRSL
jgi:CheY-like chemotaxis protein